MLHAPYNILKASVGTILCDIGGVLLNVDFSRSISKLSHMSAISEQVLRERIFHSGFKEKHDLGEISSFEFYKKILPEGSISYPHFKVVWSDIFTENKEVINYVMSLSKHFYIYIASNTDPIHYEFIHKNYPWLSMFDGFGLSFNLKAAKPSSGFFFKLCKEFCISYTDMIFIDDLNENVEAANHLGIASHVFLELKALKWFVKNEMQKRLI